MTDALNRRRLLGGTVAALSAPVAALPALAAASTGPHPDAALLALGERFDATHREWEAMRPAYDAACEARGVRLEAAKARLKQVAREGDDDGFLSFYSQICAEADPDDWIGRGADFLSQRMDPLTEAILYATPPTTLAGLAVKARALIVTTRAAVWEAADPREELDCDEEHLRGLVEAVLRLAGVDLFGRPVAEA